MLPGAVMTFALLQAADARDLFVRDGFSTRQGILKAAVLGVDYCEASVSEREAGC